MLNVDLRVKQLRLSHVHKISDGGCLSYLSEHFVEFQIPTIILEGVEKTLLSSVVQQHQLSVRPKIKFYLFAIAYLPTPFPPTHLFFFCISRMFFFFCCCFFFFAVLLYHFLADCFFGGFFLLFLGLFFFFCCISYIPKLYKLTRKQQDH